MISDKFRKLLRDESKLKEAKKICEKAGFKVHSNTINEGSSKKLSISRNKDGSLDIEAREILVEQRDEVAEITLVLHISPVDLGEDWDITPCYTWFEILGYNSKCPKVIEEIKKRICACRNYEELLSYIKSLI